MLNRTINPEERLSMKRMSIAIALIITILPHQALQAGEGWGDNFEEAKKESASKGRPILVDFTGSDWCGWCIKLKNEVFSKQAFKDFAAENLVLFVADFPSRKKLSEDVKKQNDALQEKYGIRGYPTILLLDKDGKELARTGYQSGGPEAYVTHLKELIAGTEKKEGTENKDDSGDS